MIQPEQKSLTTPKLTTDLDRLVGFPTITGQPEGFQEAMAFIREQISPEAHVKLLPNNGEPILLASNVDTLTPDVCYLVHVDVVSARPDQFSMQVKDGVAYGRGVSDMKYSIPVGYALLNDLIKSDSEISFMLAITSDEERGGFKGAGYLADELKLAPGLVIVPDGGDNFVLVNKSKGVCHIRVKREGVPAHASRPWLGDNALTPIVKLAALLSNEYQTANTTDGWHTTMNIGRLQGGLSINQVAPHAELDLDFRFPPESDSIEALTRKVEMLAKTVDPHLTLELLAKGSASFTDTEHPALKAFVEQLSARLGREIEVEGGYGSHDGRHFNQYGIPFIMTKPEGGDIHGDAEYIDLESVMVFYEVLLQYLLRYNPNAR